MTETVDQTLYRLVAQAEGRITQANSVVVVAGRGDDWR